MNELNKCNKLLKTAFTVANGVDDICTDIQFETQELAINAANIDGVQAFSYRWDGISATSIQGVCLIGGVS